MPTTSRRDCRSTCAARPSATRRRPAPRPLDAREACRRCDIWSDDASDQVKGTAHGPGPHGLARGRFRSASGASAAERPTADIPRRPHHCRYPHGGSFTRRWSSLRVVPPRKWPCPFTVSGDDAAVADAANGTTTPNPPMVSWQWPVRTDGTCQRCGQPTVRVFQHATHAGKRGVGYAKGRYAASFDPETGKRDDNLPKAWTVTVPDLGS